MQLKAQQGFQSDVQTAFIDKIKALAAIPSTSFESDLAREQAVTDIFENFFALEMHDDLTTQLSSGELEGFDEEFDGIVSHGARSSVIEDRKNFLKAISTAEGQNMIAEMVTAIEEYENPELKDYNVGPVHKGFLGAILRSLENSSAEASAHCVVSEAKFVGKLESKLKALLDHGHALRHSTELRPDSTTLPPVVDIAA